MESTNNVINITMIKVLNVIRRLLKSNDPDNRDYKKTDVAFFSGLASSTAALQIKELGENGYLLPIKKDSKDKKADKSDYYHQINRLKEIYVGISIGSSKAKMVFVDLNFDIIPISDLKLDQNTLLNFKKNIEQIETDSNYAKFCCKSPRGLTDLSRLISIFCQFIIDIKNNNNIPIQSVCCALSGRVDYDNKGLIKSPNLDIWSNVTIDQIFLGSIRKDFNLLGIDFMIEHNAKTAIVAEKEIGNKIDNLNCKDRNVAGIYMGVGIGMGIILNNQLYRGENNCSGELGHVTIQPYNNKDPKYFGMCECGKYACLEHLIRKDVFATNNKEELDHYKQFTIFPTLDPDFHCINLIDTPTKELSGFLNANKIANKEKAKEISEIRHKKLAYYLATPLATILHVLSINKLILTGKMASLYDDIESELNGILNSSGISINILKSDLAEYSAARGAAICGYYKKYNINLDWDKINN